MPSPTQPSGHRTIIAISLVAIALAVLAGSFFVTTILTKQTPQPVSSPSPTESSSPSDAAPSGSGLVTFPTCAAESFATTTEDALKNPSAICVLIIRDLNMLTALTPRLGEFSALQHLNAADIGLAVLPSEIGQLPSLRILELNNNQLTQLPDTIQNLTQLTFINLRNNPISQDEVTRLQELTSAQIAH